MSINVYWSSQNDEWQRAVQPKSVLKSFYDKKLYEKDNDFLKINYCPAFNENLKNVYSIQSLYDYSFTIKDGVVYSKDYNQKFFDNHILVRSIEKRAFTLSNDYCFFTDSDSLEMTAGEHPFLEQSEISKSCIILPGKFDIGKWFRPVELSFFLKDSTDTFSVTSEDALFYVRFHTNEKINFIEFKMTDKLVQYQLDCSKSPWGLKHGVGSMNNFYKIFKTKKLILDEIKKNIIS